MENGGYLAKKFEYERGAASHKNRNWLGMEWTSTLEMPQYLPI